MAKDSGTEWFQYPGLRSLEIVMNLITKREQKTGRRLEGRIEKKNEKMGIA